MPQLRTISWSVALLFATLRGMFGLYFLANEGMPQADDVVAWTAPAPAELCEDAAADRDHRHLFVAPPIYECTSASCPAPGAHSN